MKRKLLEAFETLQSHYESLLPSDKGFKTRHFKSRQAKLFVKILSNCDDIKSYSDVVLMLRAAGQKNPKSTLEIVKSIFDTGTHEKVEAAKSRPATIAAFNLTKVYEIGPVTAAKLYNNFGISTISQLRDFHSNGKVKLTKNQILGLKYLDDLQEKIPRFEIERLENYMKKKITFCKLSINGSFRRGKKMCGDIDILIASDNDNCVTKVSKLLKSNFHMEDLSHGPKKYMGIIKVDKKYRHIDILQTSTKSFPFAQLHFTGSKQFNKDLRSHANSLGYSLSEHSLTHLSNSGKKTKKEVTKDLIKLSIKKDSFETEADILNFLKIKFIEPALRTHL